LYVKGETEFSGPKVRKVELLALWYKARI